MHTTTQHPIGFQSSSGVGVLAYSQINYIPGGDGLAAIYVKKNSEAGNYYYTYKDHLGSLLTLTDDEGEVVFEQNFDAWEDGALKKCTVYIFSERASLQGRLRNADTWAYSNSSSTDFAWLNRGYTGHEMLPHFGLINMNNRLYDPLLGRMLAVDNYVQDPFSSQGYNRYSYCFNNPLKYNDPSGEVSTDFWMYNEFDGGDPPTYNGGTLPVIIIDGGSSNPPEIPGFGNYFADGMSYFIGNQPTAFNNIKYTVTGFMDFTQYQQIPFIQPNQIQIAANYSPTLQRISDPNGITSEIGSKGTPTGYGALEAPVIDPIDLIAGGVYGVFKASSFIGVRMLSQTTTKGIVQAEFKYSQQKVWQKFGDHFTEFGLEHSKSGMEQYLKIAKEVFKNPNIKHTFPKGGFYAGETWMIKDGKILRLDPSGHFRSLYTIK